MKSLLKFDLKNILLILLIGVVVFQQCGNGEEEVGEIINVGGKNYELLEHRIDTVYEEKIVEVPKYVPQYIERLVEVPVKIPVGVDTLKVIEEYFSTFKVTDTLKLTYKFSKDVLDENGKKPQASLGYGVITDVISQNKIQSRDIKWNFQIPTIYDTKIVKELPKNQVYMGLNTNFDRVNVVNSVGGGVILKTKRDRIYQLNTGLSNSITGETQPYLGGGMYWKIKIKK
jgi:hypothetical protein